MFASRIVDIKDSPMWNKLSFVSCACNGLVVMDESLQLLPVVETLDLSRNQFAKVDNLRKCTKLSHLDLGFNHLRTIASLSEVRLVYPLSFSLFSVLSTINLLEVFRAACMQFINLILFPHFFISTYYDAVQKKGLKTYAIRSKFRPIVN